MALGQRERERRTVSWPRLHPDVSSVTFDDAAADRKADPGPVVVLLPMQPTKHFEDVIGVDHVEPDAIVPHGELPEDAILLLPSGTDGHFQAHGRPAILPRVVEQVLEE